MTVSILRFLLGSLIGAGAILPGVSGGMLCLLFGVYQPMMALAASPLKTFRSDWRLFLPLFLGGLAGFFSLARGLDWIFDRDSAAAVCLFLGLAAGSLPSIVQDAGRIRVSFFSAGLLTVFSLSALSLAANISLRPGPGVFLLCGAVWGLSLVLPGLSSSALLISLGVYQPMTAGISSLDLSCILPVGTGIALTLLLTARGISRLLQSHRCEVLSFVLGAVCASSLAILPTNYSCWFHSIFCLMCALWGFGAALLLEMLNPD